MASFAAALRCTHENIHFLTWPCFRVGAGMTWEGIRIQNDV
jgi:hypothetical protein